MSSFCVKFLFFELLLEMHNAQLMYFPSENILKIIDSAGKNDTGQDRMGNDKICTVRALR